MRRDLLGKMNPPTATKIQDQEYRDALRFPVLMFLGSAIFWLVIGSFLSCLAAWKLVMPSLLDGSGWLTYGRVQAAAENSLWYGWASQAGMGVGFWLLAQLGRTALGSERLLVTAGAFWNFGLLLGICGILAGDGNAVRGLEFPGAAAAVLLVAYVCIGVWSLILLRDRSRDGLYVSQWYLLAAFLCFPWLYATANMLLIWYPVQGSAQGPIASWFFGALLWLWLASLVLGAVYYLVPHFAQRPVRAYPSSVLAFWLLAFFGGWMGVRQLIGGPVPAWMVSASVAANIMMLIPATIIGINTFGTLSARTTPHTPDVLVHHCGTGLFCLRSSARGGHSHSCGGNAFLGLYERRTCDAHAGFSQHDALWSFLLCGAALNRSGFFLAVCSVALLALRLGRRDDVRLFDLGRSDSRLRTQRSECELHEFAFAGVSLSSDERAGSDGGFRRHDCLCHRFHSQFA